jgi:hypothetical protein
MLRGGEEGGAAAGAECESCESCGYGAGAGRRCKKLLVAVYDLVCSELIFKIKLLPKRCLDLIF